MRVTSGDFTTTTEARNSGQAVTAVLGKLEFDERAELFHFSHVGFGRARSRLWVMTSNCCYLNM
ncbi:hypothetical protein ABIF65_010571 [Bradyrhizobium japonicum]|jgi:hypothetical protein|uniref:hypothetical protein n=1 Tax=Bradyrhizobium TaxID=374 RepID=UPI000424E9C3|nr:MULTISPECIES: hypothetical protein [Bradyrhizobium]MBR0884578.1 hypothetical protein [Bradyrhizobium liaoningense]MBR1004851.1 hypothetical protein [Bradyrhizobium liaoningense]MBR1071080.1 hypothetical protein [Bradyrhizobium liaoningense]MCP1737937.1 hypothetical protein [Bradyrhizobium japonicum]MCP1776283.1 hypothetical protein [Bradyrhizobium japonicum]